MLSISIFEEFSSEILGYAKFFAANGIYKERGEGMFGGFNSLKYQTISGMKILRILFWYSIFVCLNDNIVLFGDLY